ncbi:MAG: hypothetical protein GY853_16550 [PVC group bacterium]|nr:hypothetical protein [PVC group bacterium]
MESEDLLNRITEDLNVGIQRSVVARKYNITPKRVMEIYRDRVKKKWNYKSTKYTSNEHCIYSEGKGYKNELEMKREEHKFVLSTKQYNALNNRSIKEWFLTYIKDKKYVSRRNIYSDFLSHINFDRNSSLPHEELFRAIRYRISTFIRRFLKEGLLKEYNSYTYEVLKTKEIEDIKNIKIEFKTEVNEYKMLKDLMRYIIKNYSTTDYRIKGNIVVNGVEQDIRWDK